MRMIILASAAFSLGGCAGMNGVDAVPDNFVAPVPALAAALDAQGNGVSPGARAYERSVDLDGDGTGESLVYLSDPMFCGSGGCPLYVMKWQQGAWRIAQKIGPAQLPVYLSDRRGANAVLGVTVYGGGMSERIMALYPVDGSYPSNPTVEPAVQWRDDPGEILLDEGDAMPIGG